MTVAQTPVAQRQHFHLNPWLVAVVLLAAALAGVLIWALADRQGRSSGQTATPTEGAAALDYGTAVALLRDRQRAMNASDGVALAAFYAPDAILDDYQTGSSLSGAHSIAESIVGLTKGGLRLRVVGDPIVVGTYVVAPVRFSAKGESGHATGANVLQLNAESQIVHEWMSTLD